MFVISLTFLKLLATLGPAEIKQPGFDVQRLK